LLLAVLLGGCAEYNFVPGSPLARLNGYNRTYEQIAADDCAGYGFASGTEMHGRCVYELANSRRQSDGAYMASMGRMAALGVAVYAVSQPQYPAVIPAGANTQVYVVNNRTYTCTTAGTLTNCF
jgi:hypothetical protein